MLLINYKAELSLNWIENCVLTTSAIDADANATGAGSAILKITGAKLYVPPVTLSTEDSTELTKQLSKRFKRSVCWNKYKVIDNEEVEIVRADDENSMRERLMVVIKELKDCLFLLMIIQQVIIKFLSILSKNISF